jgi:ribose-phosphate pyrophosphokinase
VLQKIRRGDREVEVSLPDTAALSGRAPVLVDDIVSTGHTMVAVLDRLRQARLPPAICLTTHAVFAEGACERLYAAGAARVFSTDTIPHPTNAIGISTLLAAGVQSVFSATDAGPDGDEARSAGEWFGEDEATL